MEENRAFPNEIFHSIIGYLGKEEKLSFRVLNHDFNWLLDEIFLKFVAHLHNVVSKEALDKLPTSLHTLDISRSKLSTTLVPCLRRFTNLHELDCTSVSIADGNDTDLQLLLQNLPCNLQSLHLRECKMVPRKEITGFPDQLQLLDLCGTIIGDEGLQFLPRGLKYLKLAVCRGISDKGLECLPSGLIHLNLAYCNVSGEFFSHIPVGVKELILRGCSISGSSLARLPSSLHYLDIAHNSQLTGCEQLPRGLQGLDLAKCAAITHHDISNLPPNLQHLNLNETRVHGMLKLLPRGLRYLSAVDSGLDDSDLEDLPKLLHLRIGRNDITDGGLCLVPKTCLLLDLERCEHISDSGLAFLPRSLQALHMEGCVGITDSGLSYLPNRLMVLDLSFSSISDDGVACLPHSLVRLRVSHTKITNKGVQNMPQGIVMLDLSFTEVQDQVRACIPPTVEYLSLIGCQQVSTLCAHCGNGTQKISLCSCK
jgi:Leucine-rich repeat (LRR) protein